MSGYFWLTAGVVVPQFFEKRLALVAVAVAQKDALARGLRLRGFGLFFRSVV